MYRSRVDQPAGSKDLVAAYFEYFRTGFDESLFWAWETIHVDLVDKPGELLTLILALLDGAPDQFSVDLVGSGVLEDLLWRSGETVIDFIEVAAPHNPKLRRALLFVDGLDRYPAIQARVESILRDELRPTSSVRPSDWVSLPPLEHRGSQ
jgi:hypothetical protein